MDQAFEGPAGQKVVTISGLRIEVTRFGQLKIGHRVLEAEEGDRIADTVRLMTAHARTVKEEMRKPRRERGL